MNIQLKYDFQLECDAAYNDYGMLSLSYYVGLRHVPTNIWFIIKQENLEESDWDSLEPDSDFEKRHNSLVNKLNERYGTIEKIEEHKKLAYEKINKLRESFNCQ